MFLFGPPTVEKVKKWQAKGKVRKLIKALRYEDKSYSRCEFQQIAVVCKAAAAVRAAAAEALEKLGYQPDRNEAGALYWIEKHRWEKCVEIGTPAVMPLINLLTYVRWRAGEVLYRGPGADVWNKPWGSIVHLSGGKVREAAMETLGKIGDKRAVGPLIAALEYGSKDGRRAAALALVTMYRSDKLDDKHKRLILAQRATITEGHYDNPRSHDDNPMSSDCGGSYYSHKDTGIGIDFPI
jgi:hypothetical protein